MKKPSLLASLALLFLIAWLLFFLTICENSNANSTFTFQKDLDSLQQLLNECEIDTCRFNILLTYFWYYANANINRAKPIGEWAYREIRDSRNLKALSDGYDIKGVILESENKYDSAYILYRETLNISKQINYHARTGWSYYHLAIIHEAQGHADSALFYMRILYNFYESINYRNYACKTLNDIGDIIEKNDLSDSALYYYNKAILLSHEIQDTDQETRANLSIASFYKSRNDMKNELRYLNSALLLAEETNNNKAIINIYYRIGDIFLSQKKNYDIALNYYQKVLDKCQTQNNWIEANILNEIGKLYIEKGNDSLAMTYILKSLKISRELQYRHQISESYKNLGIIYKNREEYERAINNFKTCYATGCDRCPQIVFHSSLVNIADSYMELGDRKKAWEYYIKSLELAREFKGNAELALSDLKIGNYYRATNENSPERYYAEAVRYAKKSGNISLIKVIADTLSSFYTSKHDYRAANEYMSLSKTMNDSIYTIESQASMANWELKFEFERLQNENETRNALSLAEINRQKAYRNSLLIIAILLIGFGTVVYINYRRKRKDNRLLNIQKQQIEEKNREIHVRMKEITTQKNEIERISSELHDSDEMKLRFFSNISHEFRTPLTLILNPAQLLLETIGEDAEYRKQLEIICRNAQKLLDLTNQVMDLQKLDAGKLELKLEKADIVEYCLGLVSSFESLCPKKNNRIRFVANNRLAITEFDKDKIGKIMVNLLSNAFKFCYEDSVIEVRVEIFNHQFTLSVADCGIGIPEDLVDSVFKRYYQVISNNRTDGTGIGLAYVKELVGYMKGDVTIETKEKKGTKISVSVPVSDMMVMARSLCILDLPKDELKMSPRVFDTSEFINQNLNENSVLLVEDNDELRNFMTGLLKADFTIYTARDGEEGILAALRFIPNLIISDVMMPNTDGFTLCSTLKNDERTSHIPVILLTAKDGSQSSYEGYRTGADDYIIKPFDNDILKLKIRNIIATRESARKQFSPELFIQSSLAPYSDPDRNFLKRCIKIIEQNIDNPVFSVEQLATELAFSRSNLYRKIQSLTDFNPAELIRNIRMQYAEKLLKTKKMKVFEVANEVGYDNTIKFSQAFKKQYGVLPSEI